MNVFGSKGQSHVWRLLEFLIKNAGRNGKLVDISRGQRAIESGGRRVRVHLRAAYVLYANER